MSSARQENGEAKQRAFLQEKFPEYSAEMIERILASNRLSQQVLRNVILPSVSRRTVENAIFGQDQKMAFQRYGQKCYKSLETSRGNKADYDARTAAHATEELAKLNPAPAGAAAALTAIAQDVYFGALPMVVQEAASSPA